MTGRVLVVGTGLIGTSIALGLRRLGTEVLLSDTSPTAVALARDIGAGTVADTVAGETVAGETVAGAGAPDLVVVAVPPDVTAAVVVDVLRRFPGAYVTDVASVKVPVIGAVGAAAGPAAAARFVGGHPMAGRERSGPLAARADLFQGRPWVLTPGPATSSAAVAAVHALATGLGASVATMAPADHDEAVALVSHLPQVAASLVASRLRDAGEAAVGLAGQGLRDVTRIAASDPQLWAQILGANAGPVRRALELVRDDIDTLLGALAALDEGRDVGARAVLARVVAAGNDGQRLIPGKHGGGPVQYAYVGVLVPDRPGEVARLLAEVDAAGVNLEDIRIEHSLGRPTGLVEITVAPASRDPLVTRLTDHGWTVVP